MADGTGRRYYFGWIPDRANKSDKGECYWGGIFAVPHEVAPSSKNRELEVKLPSEITNALQDPIDWKYKPVEGNSALVDKKIRVESAGTLTSVASIVPAALPGPDGPRVAESPFQFAEGAPIDVKILVEHDLVEAFVGERVALTYRCYDVAEYEIGIVVQDGNAEYEEITFTK